MCVPTSIIVNSLIHLFWDVLMKFYKDSVLGMLTCR